MTVSERYKYFTSVLVYKGINNMSSDYSTRYAAKNNIALPKPKTNYMKRILNYNAALCWNSLPCDVRNYDNLNCFKYKLKKIVIH